MGDTPINNRKNRLKKVYDEPEEKEAQEQITEQLKEIGHVFSKKLQEPNERWELEEILELYIEPKQKSKLGAKKKTPEWLVGKLVEGIPRDKIKDEIEKERIRNELMAELFSVIMSCAPDNVKDKVIEWIEGVGRRYDVPQDIIKDIQKEVKEMGSETLKKSFLGGFRSSKEMQIEKIEKSTEARDVGRRAEEMVLFWLASQLQRSRSDYILLPYFRKHKGRRKRGRKQEGEKHVDIVLVDFTKKIIALIEIKNWPSERKSIYYYDLKDRSSKRKSKSKKGNKGWYKENDEPKWKQSEEDILRFLEVLSGNSREDSKIVTLKLFKEMLREQEKNSLYEDVMKNVVPIFFVILEWDSDILNGPWLDTMEFDAMEPDEKELVVKSIIKEKAELLILAEYLLISQKVREEYCKEGRLSNIKSEDFKFMKFFITFTGVLENGEIKGGRELDSRILQKFKEEGIIHIEVRPALISILDGKYWKIAEFTAQLILEILDNNIEVDKEIGNVLINSVKEEDKMIVFEFIYIKEPECMGSVKIPKWLWKEITSEG